MLLCQRIVDMVGFAFGVGSCGGFCISECKSGITAHVNDVEWCHEKCMSVGVKFLKRLLIYDFMSHSLVGFCVSCPSSLCKHC